MNESQVLIKSAKEEIQGISITQLATFCLSHAQRKSHSTPLGIGFFEKFIQTMRKGGFEQAEQPKDGRESTKVSHAIVLGHCAYATESRLNSGHKGVISFSDSEWSEAYGISQCKMTRIRKDLNSWGLLQVKQVSGFTPSYKLNWENLYIEGRIRGLFPVLDPDFNSSKVCNQSIEKLVDLEDSKSGVHWQENPPSVLDHVGDARVSMKTANGTIHVLWNEA